MLDVIVHKCRSRRNGLVCGAIDKQAALPIRCHGTFNLAPEPSISAPKQAAQAGAG